MKKLINNWENSAKHQQFIAELEQKRKNIIQKTLDLKLKLMDMKNDEIMNKQELEELLDSILQIDSEDVNEADWISLLLCSKTSREALYVEFIKTLVTWFFYLAQMEKEEEYEIAGKIQSVIDIETKELKSMLEAKFGEVTEEDLAYISIIIDTYKEEMRK